jgi:multicomponent Na+:H+ antiporter subunit D
MAPTLVLPLLVPLATALVLHPLRHRRTATHGVAVAGATASLLATLVVFVDVWRRGIHVVAIGNWPPPYGIVLVADLLSAALLVVSQLVTWATVVYATAWIDPRRERAGFYPLVFVLLLGVNGAFLTGDLFNLYVWFEVLLMASFVLLVLGTERGEVEGGIKYVSLNLLASVLFLTATGILYGIAGTLNLAHLSATLPQIERPIVTVVAMLFAVAFGIKAAVFPLFFWLPASYHTPPAPVSALFAGLLTKVGVYALLRVFTLLFVLDTAWTHRILLGCAVLTMVTGVLGALVQFDLRRLLSFQIVSHTGYMLFGLALLTPAGLVSSIFYLLQDMVTKTGLFCVAGLIERSAGSGSFARLGGLFRTKPWLGVAFLLPAFSLAGFPPLSGFIAKVLVIRAGFAAGAFSATAVAVIVSLLTLLAMVKAWNEIFWKERPAASVGESAPFSVQLVLPVLLLVAAVVGLGLAAEPVLVLATHAAQQLLDAQAYQQAVLGTGSAGVIGVPSGGTP